ncbi:MAG: ornithine cyclodeaminase family protein, partial [Candidatus Eremiobacteraeota bacterium]|nr:ornithine cyclodeaminase family protein [Candidatus Eremiobacteraeota bacterium]
EIVWVGREKAEALTPSPLRCCELAAQALKWLASGETIVPAKSAIHPQSQRHLHVMPAYCKALEVAAIKWLGDYPENRARGLPTINAVIVLSDARTGIPLAVLDGNWITGIRTAAMTAVSLQACAARAQSLTLVGTGMQARTHLAIVPAALTSLREIHVVGRTPSRAQEFLSAHASERAGVRLEAAAGIEAAVRRSDVVITATNELEASLLDPAWLSSGATVALVDFPGKEPALLKRADRIIVDDRAPFATSAITGRFSGGAPRIDAEIGRVLLGEQQGRRTDEEVVVIANLGNAALDVVFAHAWYQATIETRPSARS